jgi:hypothetical protein
MSLRRLGLTASYTGHERGALAVGMPRQRSLGKFFEDFCTIRNREGVSAVDRFCCTE